MDRIPALSIVTPTYEMHGEGTELLKRNFESLLTQTFKDFEVVISDDSNNDNIRDLCRSFRGLNIKYNRSAVPRGMARNTNNGITRAQGKLIKILYQDDYLANPNALQTVIDSFEGFWLITGCSNNPNPYWSEKNTLGSPSVLTILNDNPPLLNEDLKWTLDLEYYKRLYQQYGPPKILPGVHVVIGLGPWQETNHLDLQTKIREENL